MDLDALRLTLQVARLGSFAAAARQRQIDPSSVSRSVAGVEAEAGIRLFNRSTRSLSLTEEGVAYLDRVGPALDEIDAAQDVASSQRSAPSGMVRMTASVAFGQECIVPVLGQLRKELPDIEIELILSDGNVDLVEQGLDLAIRLAPAPKGDLISTRLRATRYLVCASPDYLRARTPIEQPDDLRSHECLRYALPGLRAVWWFRDAGGAVREVAVPGSLSISIALALRQAARCGLGPALLADWLVEDDIASGRLVHLLPGYQATASEFETGAWLLYPSRSFLPRKTRAVMEFLKHALK